MKSKFIILLIISAITVNAFPQTDEAAIKVLDEFSSLASKSPSVSIDFSLITEDFLEDINDTIVGSILFSQNSYILNMPNNTIWYNGSTSWSYLPIEQEVTITEPNPDDMSFLNRPAKIFTAYKEDYKCRIIDETTSNYIIDLYPKDTKSNIIRLRLNISKKTYKLNALEYKQKDGFTATLITESYDLTQKVSASSFEFQPDNYKNIDIIDMR